METVNQIRIGEDPYVIYETSDNLQNQRLYPGSTQIPKPKTNNHLSTFQTIQPFQTFQPFP